MEHEALKISLDSVVSHNGVKFSKAGDDFVIETPEMQWAYAVSLACEMKVQAVIEVSISVESGEFGVGVTTPELNEYVTGEAVAEIGKQVLKILIDDPERAGRIVFRNYSKHGKSVATVHSVVAFSAASYSVRDLKQLRARRYSYWHYGFDLGDGVLIDASLKGAMVFHQLNQKILFNLIDENFGSSLKGLKIFDAGCASGFHSMSLAKRGAKVTAIDFDLAGIEQAKFVQSCGVGSMSNPVLFERCDLLRFESDETFDMFFCSGLFYHLEDLVGAARKLYEVSLKGGIIHSHIVEGSEPIMRIADSKQFIFCYDGEFSFVPSASMLERILTHVGFKSVTVFHPKDRASAAEISLLEKNYGHVFLNHTAYYIAMK